MSANNDEESESRLRRYRSVAMTQMANMTRGKMEKDLRAFYDRFEAAAADPNGSTKEGWQALQEACQALQDRLKAWHAEFQKFQLGEDRVDAECARAVNQILSDISEDFGKVIDIRNEAAERRVAAIREQERREIEGSRRDLAAFTTEHQKTINQMNRDFANKARAIRRRLR